MVGSEQIVPTQYSVAPISTMKMGGNSIPSFIANDQNVAWETVDSFGKEWSQFSSFEDDELKNIGDDYFHMLPSDLIDGSKIALDVGCGSGRWTKLIAPKMKWVEAVDPSSSVFVAKENCAKNSNVRVSQASVDNLPFNSNTFDLVFSLGVLHHIPDTAAGITKCVEMVKPGGFFLVYLYYNLDNRGFVYRSLFFGVNCVRFLVSSLPEWGKKIVSDFIAYSIYLPLAMFAKTVEALVGSSHAEKIPLNYYRKTRMHIMRNDARDRFGTPLERRFSRSQIAKMLEDSGLINIRFSDRQPFWVALAQKKPQKS